MSPPFGRLAAEQAELDGAYRGTHSRLITYSEEIAFYCHDLDRNDVELSGLNERYTAMVKHTNEMLKSRLSYNIVESFLMKYVWSATGMTVVALPT